jgi:hypothetical protein
MTEFSNDPLVRRLATLKVPVDAAAVTRHVLAAPRPKPRGASTRLRVLVMVPLVLLALAGAASYYAPVFAEALADAPIAGSISGPMLREFGLAGVPHRVSMFGDKTTSAGYTAELVGGYADAGRTILFVRVDPPARILNRFGEVTLTDQFGRTYFMVGMTSDVATGENAMLFKPIDGLAANVGARLHVAFTAIEQGLAPSSTAIAGRWELTATLAVDEGRDLPMPEAMQLGAARLEFTRVRALPVGVLVEYTIAPVDMDQFERRIPDGLKGRPAFRMSLVDTSGLESATLQGGSSGNGPDHTHVTIVGSWLWQADSPGSYVLMVEWEGVGSGTRTIAVP